MSSESERPDNAPVEESGAEAWLDEVGSRAGAAIRKPAPASGLDALRRRQRTRTVTRAAGGAAGAVVLIVSALLWANRNDASDVPVVGTDPAPIPVPSSSIVPTTAGAVSIPTSASATLVDNVPALSSIGSFDVAVDPDSLQLDFAFTPDGGRMVAADGSSGWVVLDSVTGDQLMRLPTEYLLAEGEVLQPMSVAISPDGTLVTDGRTLWDLDTGEIVRVISNAYNPAWSEFSADSTKLAIATQCPSACFTVFDARTGARRYDVLTGHPANMRSGLPAFSSDGTELGVSTWDEGFVILDVADGTVKQTVPSRNGAGGGDTYFVAGGDRFFEARRASGGFSLYDLTTGADVLSGPTNILVVSPDGSRAILDVTPSSDPTRPDHSGVSVFDTTTGQVVADMEPRFVSPQGVEVQFSPDGKLVLGALTQASGVGLGLWDATTGELVATLAGSEEPSANLPSFPNRTRVRFSPDGSRIVTRSPDGTFTIWPTP